MDQTPHFLRHMFQEHCDGTSLPYFCIDWAEGLERIRDSAFAAWDNNASFEKGH